VLTGHLLDEGSHRLVNEVAFEFIPTDLESSRVGRLTRWVCDLHCRRPFFMLLILKEGFHLVGGKSLRVSGERAR
jgi:hypothetical protein